MADAVGAVRYVLGADSAELERALEKAKRSFGSASQAGAAAGAQIGSAMTRMAGQLAAAFGISQIVRFTQEAIAAAAAIGRFADQAGLSAQQFQGMSHALRDAGLSNEQLAQVFAALGRNLSDLQRNTGPFLDFLNRSAPQLVEQFRAARDVNEAFLVLSQAIATLSDRHDRLRLAQAATNEMGGRFITAMRQGRQVIDEQARGFQGMSDEGIKSAQEIERAYRDMIARISLAWQGFVIGFATGSRQLFGDTRADVALTAGQVVVLTTDLDAAAAAWRRLREAAAPPVGLAAWAAALQSFGASSAWQLTADQIKLAQGQLALFQAQLRAIPGVTEFVSQSFTAAWERMRQIMIATGETEAAIAAARLTMLAQEDAMRRQLLAGVITPMEELARREAELRQAAAQGIINETELLRALNFAKAEYNMAQLTTAQGLGVTLSIGEQYEMQLDRIRLALDQGRISAELAGRAMQTAAFGANAAWGAALGGIAQNLASAFGKSKLLSSAAALISTWESANKALALYGPTPLGYAAAAAAVVAGLANVAKINSTGPGSGAPAVGGGVSSAPPVAPAQQRPTTAFTINLIGDSYSRDQVRALIGQINDYVSEGGIVLASRTPDGRHL